MENKGASKAVSKDSPAKDKNQSKMGVASPKGVRAFATGYDARWPTKKSRNEK